MKVTRHIFDSYLSMIENSPGSNLFRHIWADFDGEKRDTMNDGKTSCAFFVSAVLKIFSAVNNFHSVVPNVVEDMIKAGWLKVEEPVAGDVLAWEDLSVGAGEPAVPHIGFYIGGEKAVSTSWRAKTPILHDYLFRDSTPRQIVAIYRGKHLMPDNVKIIDEVQKSV